MPIPVTWDVASKYNGVSVYVPYHPFNGDTDTGDGLSSKRPSLSVSRSVTVSR